MLLCLRQCGHVRDDLEKSTGKRMVKQRQKSSRHKYIHILYNKYTQTIKLLEHCVARMSVKGGSLEEEVMSQGRGSTERLLGRIIVVATETDAHKITIAVFLIILATHLQNDFKLTT